MTPLTAHRPPSPPSDRLFILLTQRTKLKIDLISLSLCRCLLIALRFAIVHPSSKRRFEYSEWTWMGAEGTFPNRARCFAEFCWFNEKHSASMVTQRVVSSFLPIQSHQECSYSFKILFAFAQWSFSNKLVIKSLILDMDIECGRGCRALLLTSDPSNTHIMFVSRVLQIKHHSNSTMRSLWEPTANLVRTHHPHQQSSAVSFTDMIRRSA